MIKSHWMQLTQAMPTLLGSRLMAALACLRVCGLRVIVPMCVSSGLAGCGTDARDGAAVGTGPDTFSVELVSTVGKMEGAPEELFGRIVAVAADRDRAVYVADGIGDVVRAYGVAGSYLGTVGSGGDGPGEFRYLRGVGVDGSGALLVRGHFRVSTFEAPAGQEWADSLTGTFSVAGHQAPAGLRGKYRAGRYLAPSHVWRNFRRGLPYYLAFDADGPTGDTVWVPPFPNPQFAGRANYPVDESSGRNVDGINRVPFEPAASWDVAPDGRVVMAEGTAYRIVEVGPLGDTLRAVERAPVPRSVTPEEARDSLRAFRERLDSVPVPLSRVRGMSDAARAVELPDVAPEIIGVSLDRDDNLWVRRWPRTGRSETLYDLYDADRRLIGVVVVPVSFVPDLAPWLSRELMVGVTRDPDTGLDQVTVYRIP